MSTQAQGQAFKGSGRFGGASPGRNGGEYTAVKDQHPAASKRKGQPSGAGAVR